MKAQSIKNFAIRITVFALLLAVALAATYFLFAAIGQAGTDVAQAEEKRYCDSSYLGAGSYVTQTETVSYATKSTSRNTIGSSFPAYYNTVASVTDNCAGVAGTILMGYYDRYHADLIPGTATGSGRFSYKYFEQSEIQSYVQAVINGFYDLMNVGQDAAGASRQDYINGLTSYVASKGLSISFGSVMTGGAIDLAKLDSAISADHPVSIFMSGFSITTSITDNGSSAVYTKRVYAGSAHIMIVYGYENVEYYNAAGQLVATKLNLLVSTGLANVSGYGTVGTGTIDAADYAAI